MIIIVTKKGQILKINEDTIRMMNRGCGGVKGIHLKVDDEVAAMVAISNN